MSVKNVIMWICLFLFGCFVLIWLVGCDAESPNTRFVGSIKVYTVGDEKCERATLDEEGRVVRAEAETVACFVYEGIDDTQIVDIGGLKFTPTYTSASYYTPHSSSGSSYWVTTDMAGVVGNMTTNDSGYCKFTCWNEKWFTTRTACGMSAKGKHTDTCSVSGAVFINFRDPCSYYELCPWEYYMLDICGTTSATGGYYMSGTPNYSAGNISQSDIDPPTPTGVTNNLSESDGEFLTRTWPDITYGYVIDSLTFNKKSGKCGQGYTSPVDTILALSHSDPNTIMFRSTPYILTSRVILSEPVSQNLVGLSFTGRLSVSGNDMGDIESTIMAISDNGKRVVAQTDGIVPIDARDYIEEDIPNVVYDRWTESDDPNDPAVQIYAPLWPDDPNLVNEEGVYFEGLDPNRFVPVHCVPVESDDTIKIEFDVLSFMPLLPYVSASWLTNDKNCDINNDGIVNLKDMIF